MPLDSYMKTVFTVIAVALSALAVGQYDVPAGATAGVGPAAAAAARPPQAVTEEDQETAPAGARGPTSTRPLRWRIAYATNVGSGATTFEADCLTAVNVVGAFGAGSFDYDVEFFQGTSVPVGTVATSIDFDGDADLVITDDPFDPLPGFNHVAEANTNDFTTGYALVLADDPRIYVSAYIVCEDGSGVASFTNVPAYPVGPTATFFQAGVPGPAPSPPRIEPEPRP